MGIISNLKQKKFNKKFREQNSFNTMWAVNRFDMSQVVIGEFTWGPLKIINYDPTHTLQIKIGSLCSIAMDTVFILGGNHRMDRISTFLYKQSGIITEKIKSENILNKGDIIIEDDVWIGYGVIILSGTHICRGAVIGAGSVVTGYVPPYSIYVGSRVCKKRFPEETIKQLMNINYNHLCVKLRNNPNLLESFLYQDASEECINNLIDFLEEK